MEYKQLATQRTQPAGCTLDIYDNRNPPRTDRLVTAPEEFKQILYDNRIFNIKKKYTLPVEKLQLNNKNRNIDLKDITKYKHSYFSKYLDCVQKNHQLLRRGACDAALPSGLTKNLTHRQTRMKTQGSSQLFLSQNQKAGYFRSANNSDTVKREKKEWRDDQPKIKNKNLPTLSVRAANKIQELVLPIRVQQFVSKGLRRVKNQSPEDASKRNKNLMLRKLDVELINYNLLGKWLNSGLKT